MANKAYEQFSQAWAQECHRILGWWSDHMVDHHKGGFFGRIDALGALHPEADKGVVLNTRILWGFSAAARAFGSEAYQALATRAYHYLIDSFWDKELEGVYWMLDASGNPKETKKQVYAQAFAIYGLSEYYLLTEDEKSLKIAQKLFHLLELHSRDDQLGGYEEAFDKNWEPLADLRLSEKDLNAAKTMNTHLHILEAYTNLLKAWPDAKLEKALSDLVEIFLTRFLRPEKGNLQLFFDRQWNLQSEEISFGHDIEASWLLCKAAEVLNDQALEEKVQGAALQMTNITLTEGVDPQSGGLWNEAHPDGRIDRDYHWWPQAEAMVGCLNAWELTGEDRYWDSATKFWQFCQQHLIDNEAGEWHWGRHHDGSLMLEEDKAGPWKGPYHHCRALIEGLSYLPG